VEKRPFLLLAPSPLGSALALDKLCGDLAERGFSVLSFSRRGFDLPAMDGGSRITYLPLGKFIRHLRLIGSGSRLKKANDLGRDLEAGRREDIEFILSRLRQGGESFSRRPLVLGGYGAGGSAALFLAASPEFCAQNPNLRGLMVVESFLWSSYIEEKLPIQILPSTPGFRGRLERGVADFFQRLGSLRPRKMAGPGEVPASLTPIMAILSDRALSARSLDRGYGAIRQALSRSQEASLLVVAEGAGPLDYSDCRGQYPLMSVLFPGVSQGRWNQGDYAGGTASLMAGFAALILESAPGAGEDPGRFLVPGEVPAGGLYLERRLWNLPDPDYIVEP
jgi:hypothetical protein